MRLELGRIKIKDVVFGAETKIDKGVLYIDKEAISKLVLEDEHIKSVDVQLANPGDETRITPVKDVIEPRVKVAGAGGIFPGFINKVTTVGEGQTNVLEGTAVVTCGKIVGFQEGLIDMSGPGAQYTPFSKTHNICLVMEPADDIPECDHEVALRIAGLKVADLISKAGIDYKPDGIEVYETRALIKGNGEYRDLPKVAYVYMLQSQGLLHDTYVYGVNAQNILPTFMYPTEIMDGAILSGNCVSACDKNTTYHHQNNPVIKELYAQHGREINFVGVIVTNESVYLADKERSSDYTAKLCEYLGVDAVIISAEGFGNPDTDLIMNCKKIEAKDIKTVLITDEYAGRDGASQSLADADAKADAVITGGNANELIQLPPMKKVIGMLDYTNKIAGSFEGSQRPDGSIEAEIQVIIGATNEIGFNKMSVATY